MTKDSKERLIRERVRALAMVVLTRRDDLIITETREITGIDLHVYIDQDEPMRLVFGLVLRGSLSALDIRSANKIASPTITKFQGLGKFTYPVSLFLFNTREDKAFFYWLAEPKVIDGSPKLIHHKKPHCVELTDDVLDHAIEQIIPWKSC